MDYQEEIPERYYFIVVTGRFKVYDHEKQIATADDEESARLIVDALNAVE